MKGYFQCRCCGSVNYIKTKDKPKENGIYIDLWCSKCKDVTQQLNCGEDLSDWYELYDLNNDPRYYNYKTK